MSETFTIDIHTGLAGFTDLRSRFGVANAVTFSNEMWGNMNDVFALHDEEKNLIRTKDQQLADVMGTKTVAVMTTPPEGTFLHYDLSMHQVLNLKTEMDSSGYVFYPLHSNGVILEVPRVEVVFAPRDCAVIAVVHPSWPGVGLLHLGAPQTMQGLHRHFFTYVHALELFPLHEATVFITPFICPQHYCIKQERYQDYQKVNPAVADFSKKVEVDHTVFYEYDFMGQVKGELSTRWKITRFVESGVCNYSAAKLGNLYSYTRTKEDGATYPPAAFNVVFMLT